MADKIKILKNVYRKLDNLPLGFGIPVYNDDVTEEVLDKYFGIDLQDTVREMRIDNLSSIMDDSIDEMMIENRTIYYALRRFRMSASIYFKFSTAVDGRTVDKTAIPKMLSSIISEYDIEFKRWRSGNLAKTWYRNSVLNYTPTNGA